MTALGAAWRRLGTVPALAVVAAMYGLAILAGLALDDGTAPWIGVLLLAVFVLYCVARPYGGRDLFWTVAGVAAMAKLARDPLGAPSWISWLVLPIVLLVAWSADRQTRAAGREGDATADTA